MQTSAQTTFGAPIARSTFLAAIACGLLMMGPAHAVPKPKPPLTVAGLWEQSDDTGEVGAWFLFEEKDGFFDGRLVKTFEKPGEPVIEYCTKCTGDQKNARMLGLTIINGMKRYGLKYKDGSILDPRDGNVYHAEMTLSPDGKKLDVRGYLMIPLLGKTQTWNRLPDDAIAPEDMPPEVLATGPDMTPPPAPPTPTPIPAAKATPKPSPSAKP